MKNIKIILIVLTCWTGHVSAQDYHFSQFDALMPAFQPAETGMFTDYVYRTNTQYRNQWRPLAAQPFSTFGMSFDIPLDDRWGVGGYLINYDGAKIFNSFNFVGSVAYQITDPRQKKHKLTTGLQVGLIYKNTNNKDLLFDAQYSSGTFNSELPDNENFQRFNKLLPEINAGVFYKWIDKANSFHPFVGASIFHVTAPKEQILGTSEESRLPRRYLFHGGCTVDLTRDVSIDLKSLYMWQGQAKEFMIGLTGGYMFPSTTNQVLLGGYVRAKDAFNILAGVQYNDMTFTIGYDITTSPLKSYNKGAGAIEFTLGYSPRVKE